MADVKISQLPAATTPVDGTEVLPIVQSATTKQVSIANLTAGRAMSATSLTLSTPLAVTSGGTGLATTAQGTLLSSTALNTISATATPTLGVAGTTAGSLGLSGSSSGVVTLNTAAAAGTWSMTLPTSGGTNGYILTTNGSGVTSWTNPTALGVDLDVGSTAVTGGTDKYILYNNNGTLGNYAVTGTGTTAVMSTSPALSGNVTLDSATFSPSSPGTAGNMAMTGTLAMGSSFLRNRIINGGMQIDQRNAGASVTPATGGQVFITDRFSAFVTQSTKLTSQQSTTAPTGFVNSLLVTSSSAYSVVASDRFSVRQGIEGVNCSDLGWGTASARTVTFSFWVRSSLTGTFGGSLKNSAGNRSYPYTYSISSADTWEYKTITVPGDTTGTWLTDTTGAGIYIIFGLGTGSTFSGTAGAWAGSNFDNATGAVSVVGTNGATWYVTGVQLEVGSVATPFERRQYGTELMLCQRYYWRYNTSGTAVSSGGVYFNNFFIRGYMQYPAVMRTAPAIAISGNITYSANVSSTGTVSGLNAYYPGLSNSLMEWALSTASTLGYGAIVTLNGGYVEASSEL
jgi:hypothetical protein